MLLKNSGDCFQNTLYVAEGKYCSSYSYKGETVILKCHLLAGPELGKDSDLIHSITVPSSVLTSILLFWLLKKAEIRLGCMQARPQRKKERVIGFKNY